MSIQARITKAKMKLMINNNAAFIASIVCSSPLILKEDMQAEAATDGNTIYINPKLTEQITDATLLSNLVHEAWHIVLKHIHRKGNRDHEKFNVAADYAINPMLKKNGYDMTGFIYEADYENMSAEEIYELLPKGSESLSHGDLTAVPAANSEEVRAQVEARIIASAVHARTKGTGYGNVPSYVEIAINQMVNPTVPWQNILQNVLTRFDKTDYSFRKPNKKRTDIFLPTLYKESLGTVVAAIDVSCSVNDEQVSLFLSELDSIQQMYSPELIKILSFNAQICGELDITPSDSVYDFTYKGRGGTDLHPVFERLKDEDVEFLIVFSDLECNPITEEPPFPVIWICIDNPDAEVNFGTLIHVNL